MNVSRRRFLTTTAAAGTMLIDRLAAAAEDPPGDGAELPKPTPVQLAWQDAELGLLYCYELHVFNPARYGQPAARKTKLDLDLFNPPRLDTDQWMEGAVAMGAKFAILTASHESGFRLWQSDANPFSLKSTRWGGGTRDVVGEFVESCRKAGIKPGIYLGTRWNAQLEVLDHKVNLGRGGDDAKQAAYARLIEREVTEICTRYGELFELWFDGGGYTPDKGGPDVLPIFDKHQPGCIFYHNEQRSDVRWGGSESGMVGYPCWATVPWKAHVAHRNAPGWMATLRTGDPEGKYWSPAMADAPLRNHEWFWEPDDERKIYSLDKLTQMYYNSVGRNATLILGATPDTDGRMPEADTRRMRELGDRIRRRFANLAGETSGEGPTVELVLDRPRRIDHVVIMEDIVRGERVRAYQVEGLVPGGQWQKLCEGISIGHKRIQPVAPVEVAKVRLRVSQSVATPQIRRLAVYAPEPA